VEKRVVIPDENINVPDEWKNETLVQHYRKEFKRVFGEYPDMNYSRDGAILHFFACHAINSGVGLETVRVLLGHSDFRSTLIYARVKREKLQEAVMEAFK
jgi:integrase